jgi:hypothetical protein
VGDVLMPYTAPNFWGQCRVSSLIFKLFREENPMIEKELEKHNFLTWSRHADAKETENAKGENHEVWERLYNGYANEIEVINRTKQVYESFSQHETGIQKFDLSLKISI